MPDQRPLLSKLTLWKYQPAHFYYLGYRILTPRVYSLASPYQPKDDAYPRAVTAYSTLSSIISKLPSSHTLDQDTPQSSTLPAMLTPTMNPR